MSWENIINNILLMFVVIILIIILLKLKTISDTPIKVRMPVYRIDSKSDIANNKVSEKKYAVSKHDPAWNSRL